jgi:twitching motility protein PilT
VFVDRRLSDILKDAVKNKASGILFTNGNKPYVNIANKWIPSKKDRVFDFIEVQEILWQVMDLKLQNMFFSATELNFNYSIKDVADFSVEVEKNNERLKAEFKILKQYLFQEDKKNEQIALNSASIDIPKEELAIDLEFEDFYSQDDIKKNIEDPEKIKFEPVVFDSLYIKENPENEDKDLQATNFQDSKENIKLKKEIISPLEKSIISSHSLCTLEVKKPVLKHRYLVKMVDLLRDAYHNNVSDVHIGVGNTPLFRKDGFLRQTSYPCLNDRDTEALLTEVITDLEYETLIKEKELDIGFGIEECRLRGNICFEMNRMAGVFRLIPPKIMTLDDLKTPKVFKALMNKHKGLILFTGPTGSGKSTSLAAMIDYANKRKLGRDTLSFSEGLKRALRQDPDIILVGEMRDLETIQLAILASETGHLVLSTLHTSSAAKSIHRIIDVFPPHQQSQIRMTLSENLLAVISQTLIQRKDKKGREAAFEILINTNAVSNLIREEKVFQIPTIIETQSHIGMISMDQSLYDLVKNGSIDYKDALGKSNDPKLFKAKLKKGGIFDEIVSGSAES